VYCWSFNETKRFASSIISSSKSLQTPKFCYFISMDHKGSISLLISSLGINMLLHRNGSSYPTTKPPQRLTQQLHLILLIDWTNIQDKINECNIFYPLVSPSQKPRSSHNATCTLSLGWNTLCTHHLKIPKVITHELPHNHSKNPWHTHHLPCVGPYIKHVRLLDLFLTFLAQWKFNC
jgi:hypothetical protein